MARPAGPHRRRRYVNDVAEEMEPILSDSGPGAEPPLTVFDVFKRTVSKYGPCIALRVQRAGEGKWIEYTWEDYYRETIRFAKSLLHIGFRRFSTVNIIGGNSPEWFFANCGAIAAGGVAAGICEA